MTDEPRILSIDDAFAFLRLCYGNDAHVKAVAMIQKAYAQRKQEVDNFRDHLNERVASACEEKLANKDRELARMQEWLARANYRLYRVREGLYAHPEDEDDT